MAAIDNVAVARSGESLDQARRHAMAVLDRLGLADIAMAPVGRLPQSVQRRIEIARALALQPALLFLDDVSLQAAAGEVVALLGANGAGKSSLLRAIMGFSASRGEIRLDGASLAPLPPFERSRQGVAYCPEGRRVFPRMTVHENLEVARRRGVERLAEIYGLFPALVSRASP